MFCNFRNCRNNDAAAEAQRGLVTSLESDARGKEELAKALRLLAAHSLPLGSPSLARFCNTETRVSIANRENTKVYVIKEPKLLVQMIDGVEN